MDLERVDRITAGAVGEPGERTFFLQAREGDRSITILVEKEQVELLGTSILEILATVGRETGEGRRATSSAWSRRSNRSGARGASRSATRRSAT